MQTYKKVVKSGFVSDYYILIMAAVSFISGDRLLLNLTFPA